MKSLVATPVVPQLTPPVRAELPPRPGIATWDFTSGCLHQNRPPNPFLLLAVHRHRRWKKLHHAGR